MNIGARDYSVLFYPEYKQYQILVVFVSQGRKTQQNELSAVEEFSPLM